MSASAGSTPFARCPKCGHAPLPIDPSPMAACPACGMILTKAVQASQSPRRGLRARSTVGKGHPAPEESRGRLRRLFWHVPERIDVTRFWLRVVLWAVFAIWGLQLIALDHRSGEMGASFLHGPLLVFHEAGHVIFRPLGEWMGVLGGTLAQLLMPAVLGVALLFRNRDPFGAAIGLWFLGVSLLDVAPYIYDALHPRLMLLTGSTGEDGGHDWIYLLSSVGWLPNAEGIGTLTHRLGALVVLLALVWAAGVLWLQKRRVAGDVLTPE